MSWHVPEATLRAYSDGRAGDADAWSVEAHLVECERCRHAVGGPSTDAIVSAARPAALPPQGRVRRAGRWRGAVLLTASGPAARTAWLVAAVVVLALAVAMDTTWESRGFAWLTLVAPLLPVAGVATAYGSGLDEPGEIVASTPAGGLRLLLWRTLAVLAVSVPAALLAGVWAGSPAVWLLPALGLTAVTLAVGSVTGLGPAAVAVGLGWAAAVAGPSVGEHASGPLLAPDAVTVWIPLTLAAAATVVLNQHRFAHLRRPSREA
ncbi:zf-HC2 domain-containing protein [Jiangella endophytica]|uniref:zf-HC2 domain-containing protein n=1 Tax=Jiangella endophytica TaxID=1623398 RepID=UPI000E348E52|nr:zf-HC2 domain-containing protein [Jiangella endophytica]